MTLPGVRSTITDGALGLTGEDTSKLQGVVGVCSSGTANTPTLITDEEGLAAFGRGPAVNVVLAKLPYGPVVLTRVTAGTSGSNSAVAQPSGSPPAVGLTGTPEDQFDGKVEILVGGARATATFRYTIDGGDTWSEEIVTAATYAVPNSGLTITFATGTYVLGDVYTWTSTAPYFSTTNVGDALDAIKTSQYEPRIIHIVGVPGGADDAEKASNAATVVVAVQTKLEAMAAAETHCRAIVEMPDVADAALITAFASVSATRVACVAGFIEYVAKRGVFKRNASIAACAKLGAKPLGKDPGELNVGPGTGPVDGVKSLYRDEQATQGLNAKRFVTLRKFKGRQGVYVTKFPLMSPTGSDFKYLQHGQVIDEACIVARNAALPWVNRDVKVKADFTIDELEARALEQAVRTALQSALVNTGDVSDVQVLVNRTDNVVSTEKIRYKVRVLPKGYATYLEQDVGFAPRSAVTPA